VDDSFAEGLRRGFSAHGALVPPMTNVLEAEGIVEEWAKLNGYIVWPGSVRVSPHLDRSKITCLAKLDEP
jgi:hypothetical protein